MFQPYEFFVGLRYTRAKRRNHFISFISLISMLGIALGITALITVMSVMNGFERDMRERILGMVAHAEITLNKAPLREWQKLSETAKKYPKVIGTAPYVEGQVMAIKQRQSSGTLVRGIDPITEPEVSDIADKMIVGSIDSLQSGEFNTIIGAELADFLGVIPGDKITVIAPQVSVTPAGILPRFKRFTVTGIFKIGMYEFDRSLMLLNIDDASRFLQLDGGVTGVRLKLNDLFASRSVVQELASDLNQSYWVSDWTHKHSNWFQAVRTEKTIMFIILTMIIAVAAFNIISTLVMVVTDKQFDIAILRTLGSSPRSILLIFLVQGALIGIVGTLLGLIGGISLAQNVETIVPFIEHYFNVTFLDPSVYYLSEIPSDLQRNDVISVTVISFLMTLLATLYPALRASRTNPAEALRYE